MPQFRKKPVIILAERTHEPIVVKTLEGDMQAEAGDWLIRGVEGEVYSCKDRIFRKTYEPVDAAGVRALAEDSSEEVVTIPFPGISITEKM